MFSTKNLLYLFRDYLHFAEMEFKNIRDTREPMMFPLSKLILSIAEDDQTKKATLSLVKPLLEQVRNYFLFDTFPDILITSN